MSLNYKFARFETIQEQLTFQERKDRTQKGIPIKEYLALNIKLDDFLEKLFGVNEFIFVPKKEGSIYHKNMTEKFLLHTLYLLNKAAHTVNADLFNWMNFLLQGAEKLIRTEGWLNNRLLEEEIVPFNQFMVDKNNVDLKDNLKYLSTPLAFREINFYVNKDRNKIVSEEVIQRSEYSNFEPNVLFEDKDLNEMERLECAINVLCDFLQGLKIAQSYNKENINYNNGETDDYIHSEVIAVAKQLGGCLRYMINCTSWRNNELFLFDDMELELKCKIRVNESFCQLYQQTV